MTRSRSASSHADGIQLVAVGLFERLRAGDLVEQVEPDAVGLEPELALHDAADHLPARQVAEVARVVVGDESAGPAVATISWMRRT